jgi:hypothetical protein
MEVLIGRFKKPEARIDHWGCWDRHYGSDHRRQIFTEVAEGMAVVHDDAAAS